MATQRSTSGLGISACTGLILLAMGLPWLAVSCNGQAVVTQNGYQAMTGDTSTQLTPPSAQADTDYREKQFPAWWLGIVILAAIAAGAWGYQSFAGSATAMPRALAASLLAAVLITGTPIVGFPLESEVAWRKQGAADEQGGSAAMLGQATVIVEREFGLWLTLLAAWGQVGIAAFVVLTSEASATRRIDGDDR